MKISEIGILILFALGQARAIEWEAVYPASRMNDLNEVIRAKGKYWAVGDSGTVISSKNGSMWQRHTVPTTASLEGIAHGNDLIMAVGEEGVIITSPDGADWNIVDAETSEDLQEVQFLDGEFRVVAETEILATANGNVWTFSKFEAGVKLRGITHGDRLFVTVGWIEDEKPEAAIYTSVDGEEWDRIEVGSGEGAERLERSADARFGVRLRDVAYWDGRFVAVGSLGCVMTSDDGNEWTRRPTKLISSITSNQIPGTSWTTHGSHLYSIIPRDEGFVAVGHAGLGLVSSTGSSWPPRTWQVPVQGVTFLSVVEHNGSVVAVGDNGAIRKANSRLQWDKVDDDFEMNDIAAGNGHIIAVGREGRALVSVDEGFSWEQVQASTNYFSGIAFGHGLFVATTLSGVLTTEDGKSWRRSSGVKSNLRSVVFADDRFVAVGYPGVSYVSPDGKKWTKHFVGDRELLLAVTYGDGQFVAGGMQRNTFFSTNGKDWERVDIDGWRDLIIGDIAFGNDTFVLAAKSSDRGLYTWDGEEWTRTNTYDYETVEFDGEQFLGFTYPLSWDKTNRPYFVSEDGFEWAEEEAGDRVPRLTGSNKIVHTDGRLYAVGEAIFRSLSDKPEPPRIAGVEYTGTVRLSLLGQTGSIVEIESSTDLVEWESLDQSELTDGEAEFIDQRRFIAPVPEMYYRLRVLE
ncbi:MAG: hypothetical protein QGG00_09840 [Verrucomicrobiota bacterium]|nr:hypothetical protein [Verrucomicrobiota bacterium]